MTGQLARATLPHVCCKAPANLPVSSLSRPACGITLLQGAEKPGHRREMDRMGLVSEKARIIPSGHVIYLLCPLEKMP